MIISIMKARPKKKKSKKGAIEKQPDDYEYEVNAFHATLKSKFKICLQNGRLRRHLATNQTECFLDF